MTYLELYTKATQMLEYNKITLGEFEKMIEPLKQDVSEQRTWQELLDKIKAEMHETAEIHEDGDWYLREEWVDEIIDKYK